MTQTFRRDFGPDEERYDGRLFQQVDGCIQAPAAAADGWLRWRRLRTAAGRVWRAADGRLRTATGLRTAAHVPAAVPAAADATTAAEASGRRDGNRELELARLPRPS